MAATPPTVLPTAIAALAASLIPAGPVLSDAAEVVEGSTDALRAVDVVALALFCELAVKEGSAAAFGDLLRAEAEGLLDADVETAVRLQVVAERLRSFLSRTKEEL